ncbi:MAG: hypothetical protein CBC02_008225 [Flavobacteriaceae bacterium TMED42]|nr:MAG: hypothetical protein CBC02_008225 [Flavobacteriaceae bacterium TMED42]|tara:strand:- start:179 stop:403 length:225 start_codon:yes stop_codon:yes gene_type:complete
MSVIDRFKLEEQLSDCTLIEQELDAILYKIGDSPKPPTEDELTNMLAGVIELSKIRHERAFNTFETMVEQGKIV